MSNDPFPNIEIHSQGQDPFPNIKLGHQASSDPFPNLRIHAHDQGGSKNPLASIGSSLQQAGRNVRAGFDYISHDPVGRTLDTVWGAPERAEQSALVGENPLKGLTDPEGGNAVTDKLEHKELGGFVHALSPLGARFPQKGESQKALLDFIVQVVHDPQAQLALLASAGAAIPGVDAVAGTAASALDPLVAAKYGAKFAKLLGESTGATKGISHVGKSLYGLVPHDARRELEDVIDHVKHDVSTSYAALKGGLTRAGLNLVRMHQAAGEHLKHTRVQEYVNQGINTMRPQIEALDAELRDKGLNRDALHDIHNVINLTPESRDTLRRVNLITDRAGWREGTQAAREAMIRRGYRPSAEDLMLPPGNVDRDSGARYLPEHTSSSEEEHEQSLRDAGGYVKRKGVSTPAHAKARGGAASQTPLFQRLEERLHASAANESRLHVQRSVIRGLGLDPSARLKYQRAMEKVKFLEENGGTPQQIARYKKLADIHEQQIIRNAENHAKHIDPNAPMVPEELKNLLSSEQEAAQRASQHLGFMGNDVSSGLNQYGNIASHVNRNVADVTSAKDLNHYRILSSFARKTAHTAQDTDKQAKAYGVAAQGRVEKAVDQSQDVLNRAAKNRSVQADKTAHEVQRRAIVHAGDKDLRTDLGNTNGSSLFGLPNLNPIMGANRGNYRTLRISRPAFDAADRLLSQADRGVGANLNNIRNAAVARDTRSVTSPINKLAKKADARSVAARNRLVKSTQNRQAILSHNAAVKSLEKTVKSDPLYNQEAFIPQGLHSRVFQDQVKQSPSALNRLGGLAVRGMFVNPLSHLFGNVAVQQSVAGGGFGALGHGVSRAIKAGVQKDPRALESIEDAKKAGATSTYGYHSEDLKKNPVARFADALQYGLTLFHDSQAAELYARKIAEHLSPQDAAEEVQKAFGRPYDRSVMAQNFKQVGANLANWVLSTAPRSIVNSGRTAATNNAIKQIGRATHDVNQDYLEPAYGVDYNPGGFANRAVNLLFNAPKYFDTSSLSSPIESDSNSLRTLPQDLLRSVPLVGQAYDLLNQPYTPKQLARRHVKPLPMELRAMRLLGGWFSHAETPAQARMRERIREGLRK